MNAQIIAHLAWTLAHFVWQGALIALLAVGLKSAVRHSAEWRYRISVGAMALMLLAPLVTFALYPEQTLPVYRGQDLFAGTVTFLGGTPAGAAMPWTTWIVLGWLAGVFCLSLRLIVGWNVAQSLVRTATNSVPEQARAIFDRLMARIPMRRAVQLLISDRVQTAVVIGWLRPVILLPLAAATGLTFEQLEAILAHELAHIRRHDFAVNVLQCCAECLLFYHPAVWWVSSEIRREREHCCDDLAISICGDRVVYASALVELESARAKPMLAMAASGSDLARRIRRIFGQDAASAGWKDAALASVLVLALLAGSALYGMRAEAEQRPSATEAPMTSAKERTIIMRTGDATADSARIRNRDQNAWYFVDGSRRASHSPDRMVSGRNVDQQAAFAAQRTLGTQHMLWFRIDERTGIIRDTATLVQIGKLFRQPPVSAEKREQLAQLQRQAQLAVLKMPDPATPDQREKFRAEMVRLQDRAEKLGMHSPVETNAKVRQIIHDATEKGLVKPAP